SRTSSALHATVQSLRSQCALTTRIWEPAPGGPAGPSGPCAPAGPCGPGIPAAPTGPAGPADPVSPRAPGGPAGPAAPFDAVGLSPQLASQADKRIAVRVLVRAILM